MNRTALPLLTLALSLATVFCWAAEPKPKASDNDAAQLKAAQDERVKALTQLVEAMEAMYKKGLIDFIELSSVQEELCDAQLDSTDEPEKRVTLLTKKLDRVNGVLKVLEARNASGTIAHNDFLRAKSQYLGIKIEVLRERSKNGPPPPTPRGK